MTTLKNIVGETQMIGYTRISKAAFYASGGFSNPANVRKMIGRTWAYFTKG